MLDRLLTAARALGGLLLIAAVALVGPALPRPALGAEGCAPSAAALHAAAPAAPDTLIPRLGELALLRLASLGGGLSAVAGGGGRRYSALGGSLRIEPAGATAFPRVELPDAARDITVAGDLAYLAAGGGGLQVIAPSPPYLRGALPTPGLAAALRVVGTRAYLAAAGSGGGLQVLDIGDPARPRLLGSAPTYGSASALDLAGSLAYVAGGLGGGVEIFDVSDPLSPTLRGALITPGAALGIAASGGRAYVAAGTCGLQVLDISDPARPQLLGALATGDEARAVLVRNQTIYVAAGAAGLAGFTSTAGLPTPLGRATLPPTGPGTPRAIDLAIDGDQLLVAAETGAYSLGLSAPFPAVLTAAGETAAGAVAVHVSATDRVYLGLGGGATIDSTAADSRGQPLGPRFTVPGPALDIADAGAALYVAGGDSGLSAYRLSPAQAAPVATLDLPGSASAVVISGTLGYVAGGVAGLHLLDISDPLSPTLSLSIDTPGAALGLAIVGDRAYVADRSGLQVVDLTNRTLRGRYSAPAGSFVQDVAIVGDRAYLADSRGLLVVDVGDPDQPALVGGAAGFSAYRLLADGGRIYLAAGKDGLLAFSLAAPDQPRLAGAYDTPGSAQDLALRGDSILVADNSGGMLTLRRIALDERVYLPLAGL